ncbi:hypothetical protein UFOVP509_36 [uncultured Caudovirales phage]|uniref:Terminase-like family n=1 Tax=uncultured Caudovirales phage TaxID=2100421 RepID=A0A6J5MK81_9CAUD|nr:hypothetical protein UFOVP509_36 [uncultured Caudovirales phage]
MIDGQPHPSVKCRWCAGRMLAHSGMWWCETSSCRRRQMAYGIHFAPRDKRKKGSGWWWLPLPIQVAVDELRARYVTFGGAAGGSKSMYGRKGRLWRHALAYPGYQGLLIRKSLEELKKTHLSKFPGEVAEMQKLGVDCDWRISEKHLVIRHPSGVTSDIFAGYADDMDDLQRLLSTEYDEIFVDEATTLNPLLIPELTTRARGSNGPSTEAIKAAGGPWCFFATNPGGPSAQLIKDLFINHAPEWENFAPKFRELYDPSQWAYVPATLEDNPYLDSNYETSLAFLSADRYEQLRHGNWDVVPGMFFGRWRPMVDGKPYHVVELPLTDGLSWFRSMDWGRVAWGVVLWWACLPDGRLHVAREWKFKDRDPVDVVEGIASIDRELGITPGQMRYTSGDPAMWQTGQLTGETVAESLMKAGLYGLTKSKNDRVLGWNRLHALMGPVPGMEPVTPFLTVGPECHYLVRSLGRVMSASNNAEDIDDPDDHALDALRYGAMSRPSRTVWADPEPMEGTMGAALASARAAASETAY